MFNFSSLESLYLFIFKMQNDFDIYGDLEEDTIFTKGVIEVIIWNLRFSIFLWPSLKF